jgi:PAS domain S-box-containing protein
MGRQPEVRRGSQPVLACDAARAVVAANRAACLLLRLSEREVVGLRLEQLAGDEGLAVLDELLPGDPGPDPGPAGPARLALSMPDGARLVVDARVTRGSGDAPYLVTLGFPPQTGEPRSERLLSAREREVLTQVALGRTGQAIAAELFLAPATVESHVSRALGKLGASNRPHGVALALRAGEIDPNAFVDRRTRPGAATAPRSAPADLHQASIDALEDPVAVLTEAGRVVALNGAWRRAAGVPEDARDGEEALAAAYAAVIGVCEGATDLAWGVREILLGASDSFLLEYEQERPDGPRWLEARAARHRDDGPLRIVVRLRDITDGRSAREATLVGRSLLDELDVAVVRTRLDGTVAAWSPGAEELYGQRAADALGRPIDDLVRQAGEGPPVLEGLRRVMDVGRWVGRVRIRRDDGEVRDIHVRHAVLRDVGGRPEGVLSVASDVGAEVRAGRALLASADRLRATAEAMEEGLLVLDPLGIVEDVNAAAARMLCVAPEDLRGKRAQEAIYAPLAQGAIFAARGRGRGLRVDADEFVRGDGSLLPVAYASAPFDAGDGAAGTVLVFHDASDAARGRGRHRSGGARTLRALRRALDDDRLRVHAQPVVVLGTGRTLRHELRPRIADDEGGLLAPGQFLPLAREHGLLRRIDRWMLGQAARLAGEGHAVELQVPVESATDPTQGDLVVATLSEADADPALLTLSIPPAALRADPDQTGSFVRRMAALGAAVALDDLGSGDGAVPLLRDLPWTDVELDVAIVADLRRRESSRGVVRAFVELAHGFRLRTVARGVDDPDTRDLLEQLGVQLGLGDALRAPAGVEEALGRP